MTDIASHRGGALLWPENSRIAFENTAKLPVEQVEFDVHPTTDGRLFDSSYLKGDPVQFSLGATIPGWIDGIPLMVVGDRMRFWIPQELAYAGQPEKPQGMLVFDVELVEIVQKAH